jgi:putative transposase
MEVPMPWKETCVMEERLKLILEWQAEEASVSELCRCYGVSRKTAYKWRSRYLERGASGLSDLSRAPLHHPQALSDAVVASVLEVRHKHPSWGPKKIRAYLSRHRRGVRWPAVSSIGELLRREGLVVPRRKRLRVPPRSAPFAACWGANDVWCIDLKGWFRCDDGARCDPLTLSDAYSRYLLRCQVLVRADGDHAWPVLEAALREYGLPRVLRSDNGPPFASVAAGGLSPFAVKVVKAGILPERIDLGQPQQNGRLERLHLTLKQETASPPAPSLRAQGRRFEVFRRTYNEERPHEALDQTPPADHYEGSARPYSGRLREPEYGDDHQVRRVRHSGEVRWRGRCIYVSESLAGEPVGLVERDDGDWDIHFGPVHLGRIDREGRFHRPKPKRRRRKPVRG